MEEKEKKKRQRKGRKWKSLGIGLLEQGAPELIAVLGVHVDEVVASARQTIIDQHLYPPAVLPEPETKDALVVEGVEDGRVSELLKVKYIDWSLITTVSSSFSSSSSSSSSASVLPP